MTLVRSLTVLAAATALLTACGGESSNDDADPTSENGKPRDTGIVATSADGKTVEFKDFTVSCRPSEEDQPTAQIVTATSGWDFRTGEPAEPAMLVEAAETAAGTTVDLPFSEEWGNEKAFLVAFITQVGKDKELSSATETATGEIEVVSASCTPAPQLEVRIDGVFASEVSDASVTVEGTVSND